MKTYKNVEKILKEHKKELADKYKIKEIGLFGSYVRREQKRRSDIDILVDFKEVPDLFKFIELERFLQRLLKKKIDLVDKEGIRPQLKNIILNEVIYI